LNISRNDYSDASKERYRTYQVVGCPYINNLGRLFELVEKRIRWNLGSKNRTLRIEIEIPDVDEEPAVFGLLWGVICLAEWAAACPTEWAVAKGVANWC
jgi:hypothetical protein